MIKGDSGRFYAEDRQSFSALDYIPGDFQAFLEQAKYDFAKKFGSKAESPPSSLEGFELIRTIGTGTFSQVVLVLEKNMNTYHALKIMQKEKIVDMKAVSYIVNEKRVLDAINFPFCVYLTHAFQDNCNLYLGMPFINGGELYTHFRKQERFTEKVACFYVAQLVLALEYLHHMGLVYRDLKPENILLDSLGFIKLTDFGFCKLIQGRTYTFCGTPDYIAPEIIVNKGYGQGVDWWALGVLTYELNAGFPPFQADNPMKLYEDIVSMKYTIPPIFSNELKSLITCLIEKDITRRYGTLKNGAEDVKAHPWFRNVQWSSILQKSEEPPFSPNTKGRGDSTNYDTYEEREIEICNYDPYGRYFENF